MDIEISVVVPEVAFNEQAFIQAIEAEIKREIAIVEQQLLKTHRSWKTPVPWQKRFSPRGADSIFGVIWTTNQTYALVTLGAPPHPILPRRRRWLRFKEGFRPKTKPRVINSVGGGQFGSYTFRSSVPRHPGHAARQFNTVIAERRQKHFTANMQQLLRREADKFFTGHGSRSATAAFSAAVR